MEFDTNPLLALAVIVLSGVLAGQRCLSATT